MKATDRHRNHRAMTALERSNFYGSLAKEIGPKSSVSTAGDLGLLSGFTVGAGGTAKTVKAILEDPFGFLGALQQMVSVMTQLGLLEKILKTLPSQMVKSVQDKQDRSNPYDKQTHEDHYKAFQYNWYLGYGSYFLLSMVVGGQATKAAKNTKTFSNIVDKLDHNGKLTQANRYLDAVKGRTTGAAKKTGYNLGKRAAKGSWHLSKRSGRRVLSGVKTAGQQYRVAQKLSDADGGTLSKIDGFNQQLQRKLGRVLARGESPKKAADGGRNYVDLLADLDDVDTKTARRLNKIERNGGDVDPLVQAVKRDDIDGNDLRRASKLLDSRDDDYADYYVSNDVSASDLAEIADEGADLSSTEVVVKPTNSHPDADRDTIWLELGDARLDGHGWLHLATRHMTGSQGFDSEEITSFFPMGQRVRGEPIPNEGLSADDVKELVYRAVRDGETSGGSGDRFEYVFDPSDNGYDIGITRMRVVVKQKGSIKTAIPEEGSSVKAWVPGHGWIVKDGS